MTTYISGQSVVNVALRKCINELIYIYIIKLLSKRECCLLVLNLVSSTLPCIRQPGPRLRVLGVCDFV
jgi:hypothetical protein